MEVVQIPLSRMATFCYLVGDESSKQCILIDPAFDTQRILAEVANREYTLTYVINTHNHPDHTAGNQVIIKQTGAKLGIHALDARSLRSMGGRMMTFALGGRGSPEPDLLLNDGDRIQIGSSQLTVIHTPGHTPGGICLYAEGHLFTGDTLFVGAVGRTDLPGGSQRKLLASIREKLYVLPGNTIVWPGHNYGICEHSTISYEIKNNPSTQ